MNPEATIEKLCATYRDTPQVALVLGAGVSKDSGVPLYTDLARQLLELAYQRHKLKGVSDDVLTFIAEQEAGSMPDPDTILQYVYNHLDANESLRLLIKEVLYRHVNTQRSHKMVSRATYRDNPTLDAVITFCSAVPGSPLAPDSTSRWETNPKIGGILTTNYDNLVEGAFGSKYGKSLLKPVAREGARETLPGKRVIPVYHVHGYVSYVDDPSAPDRVKASDLVIAEEDYYRTFYNLLGFSNVVAMSILRQFSCLFVGCSMRDRNIRRILYHLRRERTHSSTVHPHFAILPPLPVGEQNFDNTVLESFGVSAIRLDDPCQMGVQIEAILKRVYLSVNRVSVEHWLAAKQGRWQRLTAPG
jgi:hypothetical protein